MSHSAKTPLISQIKRANPGPDNRRRQGYASALTNLVDSTYATEVVTIKSVSESQIVSATCTLPANCFITDITAIATSAFAVDAAFYALNIGTASLDGDGFTVANIKRGHHRQFMTAAATSIAVGFGCSSNGRISQQLSSQVTSSLQAANTYFSSETKLYLQISSSTVGKFFQDNDGEMKVAIDYRQLPANGSYSFLPMV